MTETDLESVAVDTSVAVAYVMASHAAHATVRSAARLRQLILTSHSLAETYSVLTRLPGDARVSPTDAAELIEQNFGPAALLPARLTRSVHHELSSRGIGGGAVYDALVALAAQANGLALLTRDARALNTYVRLGVSTEVVPDP